MTDKPNSNKQEWIKLGIKILASKGLSELKIISLCEELNVTKGSFYHWFKSKHDYEMQILKFWKQKFTQGFIDFAESGENDKEKLSILCQQCIRGTLMENRLEYEINAWSLKDKAIKEFVNSVYQKRFDYLIKLLQGIYKDKKQVKKHALILYSLVVGVDFFFRKLSKTELELIFSDYLL